MKLAAASLMLCVAAAAHADDAAYELRAADATVAVGAQAAISLTIVPAAGKTVSHDGPVKVELTPDDGLSVARRRYARKDAADPAADAPRFDLKVKATAAGDHTLDLDVHFWLCGPKVCGPVHAHRTVTVHVAEPEPAPAPAPAPPAGGAPPP